MKSVLNFKNQGLSACLETGNRPFIVMALGPGARPDVGMVAFPDDVSAVP
jgi:hypothetical protein